MLAPKHDELSISDSAFLLAGGDRPQLGLHDPRLGNNRGHRLDPPLRIEQPQRFCRVAAGKVIFTSAPRRPL